MVGLGLLAKACKQYRAVGAMVELGLGDVADSIARMMFESMLAIHFVLRAEVNLTRDGVPVGPVPNRPLTTRLRTSLYLANDAIIWTEFGPRSAPDSRAGESRGA